MSTGIELDHFKVIITAEGHGQAVILILDGFTCLLHGDRSIVDGINCEVQAQRTVVVRGTDSIVAVTRGFVFFTKLTGLSVLIDTVYLITHAVLSKHLEAGEARGFIGNHVVPHTGAHGPSTSLSGVVTPGCAKDGHHTVLGPGAHATVEGTDTAESNLTETTLQEEARFTIEQHVVVNTGVGLDAVFQNETNRQTVTEVFRALKTEAGAGGHTGFHREGIEIAVGGGGISVAVDILKTRVNDTVELNVSSESRAGESTENCNSSQSLFHDLSPSLVQTCKEKIGFCKNRRIGT